MAALPSLASAASAAAALRITHQDRAIPDSGTIGLQQSLLQALVARPPLHDEGYRHWPPAQEQVLAELATHDRRSGHQASDRASQLNLLLLQLVESLPARLGASGLPAALRDEYLGVAARIVGQASQGHRYAGAGDDLFRKDLALLCLRLLPCASHVVCRSGLPRRTLLRHRNLLDGGSLRVMWALNGQLQPLLENHVHPLMLDRFDANGRLQCYRLVTALLRHWPGMGGLVGTSWYYDPSVATHSPRLAYLHAQPAAFGALFIDAPSNQETEQDALQRSAARRRAFEAGRYRPRNVTMVWPRIRLLQAPFADDRSGG